MNSKKNRRVLILSLALSIVLVIGLVIAPSFAEVPGTWEGNCPMLQVLNAEGLVPIGSCYEANYEAGLCRYCGVVNVNGFPAKGTCDPPSPL